MSKNVTRKRSTRSRRRRKAPVVAGWREWVSLPDLGIDHLKAKLDTGARSSALHAFGIERFDDESGPKVRFCVHPVQRDDRTTVEAVADWIDERDVKDSGGRVERRTVIRTTVGIGGQAWPIEVTLSRRDEMGFRMLLGRQALKRRFVVDPSASFALGDGPDGAPALDEEE